MSRPVTILLVDDDPDCRTLLRDVIEHAAPRARVVEAADGAEALDWLRRPRPAAATPAADLVYLDMEMPGLSGQEVLAAIRSDPALAGVAVVFLTGVDDEAARRAALAGGADGYVVKPLDPGRLLHAVGRCVHEWMRSLDRDRAVPSPSGRPGAREEER